MARRSPAGLRVFLARDFCSASANLPHSQPTPKRSATGFRKANAVWLLPSPTRPQNFRPRSACRFLGVLLLRFGWRWSFAATGLISFFYFLLFYWTYYNPSADKSLSHEELQFMREGRVQAEGTASAARGASLGYLLRQPKVWGLGLGWGAYNYCFYLLLTWLPSYLSISLHVDLLHSVLYTSVPWLFATFTDLVVGGWLVDALIRRGLDASRVRQTVLVVGTGFGLGILGAAHAHSRRDGAFLDQHFAGRFGSCRAGGVDRAIADRAARKRRPARRNRQLLRTAGGDFGADCYGLRGDNHPCVFVGVRRRDCDFIAGHCRIYFLAEPHRTNSGAAMTNESHAQSNASAES